MQKHLIEYLQKQGVTLNEIGKALGVTRGAVSHKKQGDRKLTYKEVVTLCKRFKIPRARADRLMSARKP